MKVALIGYGKMGKVIDKMSPTHGAEIVARIRSQATQSDWNALADADVCIDFSHPEAILSNIENLAQFQKPLVIGTTGWYNNLDFIKQTILSHGIGVIYAQNFSLGMNLFMRLVSEAAQLMNQYEQYDVVLSETHHRHKVDSPSGSAISIAEVLIDKIKRKEKINNNPNGKIEPSEVHVSSIRVGEVPGTHTVIFDSAHDALTLTHTAHDRSIWARGALEAARWIENRKGFFSINDMMEI